jgi:pimeloyl-ACP methyl ester carboxylesterase
MSRSPASSSSPKPVKSRSRRNVRWQRRVGRLFAGLLVLLVVAYLGLGAVVALQMTRPKRSFSAERSPATQQLAFTDVRFPARGGDAQIAGWYVQHAAGRHVLVLVHGKDSSRTREHSGRTAELMARLYRRGFAVLAIDLRGHGQSSDGRLSFGFNEHRDILGAVDWLRDQGYPPGSIGVLGVSLGGASSILAAAKEPAIGAVVEDCAYADIAPIVRSNFVRATKLPTFVLLPARLFTRLFEGYDLLDVRPVMEIGKVAPRPLLIIHGDADQLIPLDHAYALHAAYPQSEMWILPGVRHAAAFVRGPDAYVEHVATFFAKSLKP